MADEINNYYEGLATNGTDLNGSNGGGSPEYTGDIDPDKNTSSYKEDSRIVARLGSGYSYMWASSGVYAYQSADGSKAITIDRDGNIEWLWGQSGGKHASGGTVVPTTNLLGLSQFDTGGYTGEWGSYGKLAMLHEKEMVLNQDDTENFLSSLGVMERILQAIDLQSMSAQFGGILSSPYLGKSDTAQALQQEIHITADFPNATDRHEIEEAFMSIANLASQYANRK